MKLQKKTGIYKAANVTFNPIEIQAFSYKWWMFVAVVEGKVVFNNYRYSNTTARHQWKVRRLMHELGIKIDLELPAPEGLQTIRATKLAYLIETAETYLCDEFLRDVLKKQARYERAKARKLAKAQLPATASNVVPFMVAADGYSLD